MIYLETTLFLYTILCQRRLVQLERDVTLQQLQVRQVTPALTTGDGGDDGRLAVYAVAVKVAFVLADDGLRLDVGESGKVLGAEPALALLLGSGEVAVGVIGDVVPVRRGARAGRSEPLLHEGTESRGARGGNAQADFDGREDSDLPGVVEEVALVAVEGVEQGNADDGDNAGAEKSGLAGVSASCTLVITHTDAIPSRTHTRARVLTVIVVPHTIMPGRMAKTKSAAELRMEMIREQIAKAEALMHLP